MSIKLFNVRSIEVGDPYRNALGEWVRPMTIVQGMTSTTSVPLTFELYAQEGPNDLELLADEQPYGDSQKIEWPPLCHYED
jgi:hypothetical protein